MDSQVEHLGLLETLFGQAARALALTCAHVRRDQIYTRFSLFGHPTQINTVERGPVLVIATY